MTYRKTYDWESLREEFKSSDLSIVAFAKTKGFSANAGRSHLRDIAIQKEQKKLKLSQQPGYEKDPFPTSENMDFIPLEILNSSSEDLDVPEVTFIRTPKEDPIKDEIKEALNAKAKTEETETKEAMNAGKRAEAKPEINPTAKQDIPIELKIHNVSILLHTGFEKADLRNVLEVVGELC